MPDAPARFEPPYRARLDAVRDTLASLGAGALIVTHPPNLRYLCGFDGSLGALLVTSSECSLIVDGRYITIAKERAAASEGLRHLRVELAPRSIDDGIAFEWARTKAAAVGVEGAVMTLDRFTRLQSLIPARFVTTERVVEAARMIKEAAASPQLPPRFGFALRGVRDNRDLVDGRKHESPGCRTKIVLEHAGRIEFCNCRLRVLSRQDCL